MAAERGVVLNGTGGVWHVRNAAGEVRDAVLRGRLKKSADPVRAPSAPRGRDARRPESREHREPEESIVAPLKLAVGDDVVIEPDERGGAWAISEILPRRSRLARRAPGGGHGERIVAANVDQVVIVFAAAKPDPHPRMLDRFLVIAEGNDLPARIVVNKIELVGLDSARRMFADYERAEYLVHYTSVKERIGLEEVRETLRGKVSVLSGPSGVGKSSLLNTLFPGLNLRVGEISESVNKGRHTTVGASMHPLPSLDGGVDGYVVDSPGLREVGLWGFPSKNLEECFRELLPYVGQCRFADCAHIAEPECAIREAVRRGEVSAARFESFLKLREELEASERVR